MDFKKFGLVLFLSLILLASTAFALAPVTTIDGNHTTAWQASDANIGLTCTPADSNTCLLTQYRIDSGAWTTYSSRFFITTDGNHKIDFNSIAGYAGGTLTDANATAETMKTAYTLVDETAPTVGATSISGFTQIGSNFYGTGSVVGGTVVDTNTGLKNGFSDKNTSSCQYTANGSTWSDANWSTNHCVATNITINGGRSYTFGTRIKDNVGNLGTGAVLNVQGAMVAGDMGSALMDTVGQFFAGLAGNVGILVALIILVVVVVLITDLITGTFGIIVKIKELAGR